MMRMLGLAVGLTTLMLASGNAGMAQAAQSDQAAATDTSRPLALLAREARTPAEHAKVAKEYRLQAESFEAAAAEHEAAVARLSKNRSPMMHKWPAMAAPDLQRARQQAMEARRAARESRELADRHVRMTVEALAND